MVRILIKRALGALTFIIGLTLVAWFVYNQFWPTEEFKSGFRSVFQLLLPIGFLVLGWRWMRYEGKGIEEVIPPDLRCAELDASVEEARASLPEFIREVEKGIDGAFVKFPLHTPQGRIEHIWPTYIFTKTGVSMSPSPMSQWITNRKAKAGVTWWPRMSKTGSSWPETAQSEAPTASWHSSSTGSARESRCHL
jgi:hypothetical protein